MVALIIIIGVVILLYVVLFRSERPQTAPVGETGEQQGVTAQPPQQGDQGASVEGEQGAIVQQPESPAEEGIPGGAATEATPTP